jgi:CHRD domain
LSSAQTTKSSRITGQDGVNRSERIKVTVNRDATGNITSGTAELVLAVQFSGLVPINGLQIHSGKAGQNGNVVVDLGPLSITSATGKGKVTKIISLPADSATLEALKRLIHDPDLHYVEICTTD